MFVWLSFALKCVLTVTLLICLISCGNPFTRTDIGESDVDNPFSAKLDEIKSGQSTRMDVYSILGNPCWTNDNKDTDIFGAWGSRRTWGAAGLFYIPVVPTVSRAYWRLYFVIIRYDDNGIVEDISELSELESGVECHVPDNE
jgi:hypothetical protein